MKIYNIAIVSGLLMLTDVWAESAVDYRYIIQGQVLDDNRQGISNQKVNVYKGKILLETDNTDAKGFYSLKLKLRDTDNKQVLRLRAGTNEALIRVAIDAKNITTSHIHQANFVAGKLIEGRLSNSLIPPWIYPIAGLLGIGFLAVKLEKRRKKKIQLQKDKVSGRQSTSNHHTKKKRRKKH